MLRGSCIVIALQLRFHSHTPASFWVNDVPSDCLLRQVGIRVMSTDPSSTAVERLWNSFGDNLTAKRRSLLNDTFEYVSVHKDESLATAI
jgi:hypothetical protein